jgi:hypothetical protein
MDVVTSWEGVSWNNVYPSWLSIHASGAAVVFRINDVTGIRTVAILTSWCYARRQRRTQYSLFSFYAFELHMFDVRQLTPQRRELLRAILPLISSSYLDSYAMRMPEPKEVSSRQSITWNFNIVSFKLGAGKRNDAGIHTSRCYNLEISRWACPATEVQTCHNWVIKIFCDIISGAKATDIAPRQTPWIWVCTIKP